MEVKGMKLAYYGINSAVFIFIYGPILWFMTGRWNSEDFNQQVYINGKLDSEGRQDGSGINLNSEETLKIGAQITGTPRYFIGLVDEVAVYGRVLTENEIKIDMEGMASVQPSGKLSTTWAETKMGCE